MRIGYVGKSDGERWLQEAEEISLMLGGLIKTKRTFIKPK
jgi:hypothetical protein